MARKGSNGDQQIGQGGIVWTNEKRRLGDLIPWPRNPRQIKKAEARRLVESVDEFGQVETLAIGPGNDIYNGHQRLNVLMAEHGPDLMVDVRVSSRPLSEKEREKLTVLLHRGAAGSWDFDLLANEFDADELIEWGFEAGELGLGVDGGSGDDAEPQIDRAEELRREWGVEAGQLWRLPSRTPGQEHRLICGDCTEAAVVERVMGGERAHMIFTDPPYGVDYNGGAKKREALTDDHIGTDIYERAIPALARAADDTAPLYLWYADGHAAAAAAAGYQITAQIIWAKNHAQFVTSAHYKGKHEPCYYGHKRGRSARWFGPNNEVTLWECDRSSVNEFHPTQKPVALAVRAIGNSTQTGDIILDGFLGGGTTLIAAENLARQCRAVEISPGYCAVALQRYLDTFGIRGELAD